MNCCCEFIYIYIYIHSIHTLASVLTFFKGLEVVGISKATTVEEASAFFHLVVEEVARYEASAWTRLVLQVAWTLFVYGKKRNK